MTDQADPADKAFEVLRATDLIVASAHDELAARTAEATYLTGVLGTFAVTDAASLILATDSIATLRALRAALDGRRKEITSPLFTAKQTVDKAFKAPIAALEGAENALRDVVGAYTLAKERERATAALDAANEYAAGGMPTGIIPSPAAAPGLSTRFRWIADVVDADSVPRDLCSPDPEKIARAIAYADTPHRPPRPIPGLEFREDVRTVVRGAR